MVSAALDFDREIWLRADPASAAVARAFVTEAAEELAFERPTVQDLCLGTTEAVANAVQHGSPCEAGLINVSTYVEASCLMIEVRDCGDFREVRQGDNRLQERGRGLPIMSAVMDHVEIDSAPGRTVVRLARELPRQKAA